MEREHSVPDGCWGSTEKCLLTVMVRAVPSGPPGVDEQATGMNLV